MSRLDPREMELATRADSTNVLPDGRPVMVMSEWLRAAGWLPPDEAERLRAQIGIAESQRAQQQAAFLELIGNLRALAGLPAGASYVAAFEIIRDRLASVLPVIDAARRAQAVRPAHGQEVDWEAWWEAADDLMNTATALDAVSPLEGPKQ